MGLGKTVQSVTFIEHLRSRESLRGPYIVVAPLSTLQHWRREIEAWTDANCIVYHDEGYVGMRMVGRDNNRFPFSLSFSFSFSLSFIAIPFAFPADDHPFLTTPTYFMLFSSLSLSLSLYRYLLFSLSSSPPYPPPYRGAEGRRLIRQYEFRYNRGTKTQKKELCKFNILLTSYHIVLSDWEELRSIRWRCLVVDEAHRLKNRDSQLWQAMKMMQKDSILLLTGTPLQNGIREMWSLLHFIAPEQFPSELEFAAAFENKNDVGSIAKLHDALRPYMLRRTKEDVEKSIPPKVHHGLSIILLLLLLL